MFCNIMFTENKSRLMTCVSDIHLIKITRYKYLSKFTWETMTLGPQKDYER